jgi:hypothetical protein
MLAATGDDVAVVQENGFSDYLFVQNSPPSPGHVPLIGNPTYIFGSTDIPITRFGLPDDLPGGDTELQIMFSGQTHVLHPKEEFIFTDFVPSGVQYFYLTGFDLAEGLDRTAVAPFMYAFQYAHQGATFFFNGVITPGNYDLEHGIDGADFDLWKSTFGSTTDLRADGNQDGIVDAADYVVWRKWQSLTAESPPAAGAAAESVPEPSPLLLVLCEFCAFPIFRRFRSDVVSA